MKKIIPYICIGLFIAAFFLVISKINKNKDVVKNKEEISYIKQQTIDSLISAAVNDTISSLNNAMKKRDEQIINQANRILDLKKNYTRAVSNYDADTVHTPACDSVVTTSRKVITAQQKQIDTLNRQVVDSEHKDAALTKLVNVKENTIASSNQVIAILKKQVKRTWWERNMKWISFGFGLIGGYYIHNAIK